MKRSTAAWTVTATAAALLALPPASAAQSTAQPPATTQSPAQPPASAQGENAAAQEQLRLARTALNDVQTASLSAHAKTQVAELKRRLTVLERTANAPAKTWGNEVAAMDKILGTLLAGDDTPTGTSGTATPPAATAALDETSRVKLSEVRAAITAYAAAMSGQPAPSATSSTAASSAAAPAEPSAASAQPSTPAGTASSQATAPAAQPPAASTAQTPATETAQAQPDEQAARKHLTEARNTLSEMTQLPAAAQLSGDARTQVSQLISNFNELITTQTEWRASYAKVTANLTALLGPDTGTTDPSSASGTAGAVGTSGTTTPNIDPAIRGKLVELRKNLADFERIAAGAAPSSSSAAAASSATPSSSSAAPSSTTSTSAATSTSPAAASADPSASASAAAPHAESMRLIAAIESMLKSQNEGGGLTLDKTQADMLRTHLADLKRLLEQAKK